MADDRSFSLAGGRRHGSGGRDAADLSLGNPGRRADGYSRPPQIPDRGAASAGLGKRYSHGSCSHRTSIRQRPDRAPLPRRFRCGADGPDVAGHRAGTGEA